MKRGVTFTVVLFLSLLLSKNGTTNGLYSNVDDKEDDDFASLFLSPINDFDPQRKRFIRNGRCGSKCWLPPNNAAPNPPMLQLLLLLREEHIREEGRGKG
mmetsp:Transcript_46810/g.47610  ORF Transcript_46810/g.47610 Transcript_46810/m.47610 type:complete len:100 (-) Transcript_46810:875-1174(-)